MLNFMALICGLLTQFFPIPAGYDAEVDTWWGIILTEVPALDLFLQDLIWFRASGWYPLYMLMCTLIFTAYLLSLSSHAVKNGLYTGKYTFENFVNEALDHASTHIKVLEAREHQHVSNLSALKNDVDLKTRRSNAWKNKYEKTQHNCQVLQSTLNTCTNDSKAARDNFDQLHCTRCLSLEEQILKETFYRKDAICQGTKFADRALAAEEKIRDARFKANVIPRNNHASSATVDTDRKVKEQAAANARMVTSLRDNEADLATLKKSYEQQLEDRDVTVNKLEAAANEKDEIVVALEAKMGKLHTEIEAANEAHSSCQEHTEAQAAKIADLQTSLSDLKKSYDAADKEHTEAQAAKDADLQTSLRDLNTKYDAAEKELRSECGELLKGQEAEFLELKNLANLKYEHDTNHQHLKIVELERKLSVVLEEQLNLQTQLKVLRDTPVQPVENHTACETRIRELEKAIRILKTHLKQGKLEYDEKERRRSALEVQCDSMQKERDTAQRDLNTIKLTNKTGFHPLQDRVNRLERDLRAAKTERDGSSANNKIYRTQKEQLTASLTQAQTLITSTQVRVVQLTTQNSALSMMNNSLRLSMQNMIPRPRAPASAVALDPRAIGSKRSRSVDSDDSSDDEGPSKMRKAVHRPAPANPDSSPEAPPKPSPEPDYLDHLKYSFGPAPQ